MGEPTITSLEESLESIVKQISSAPKARPGNDLKASAMKIYNILMQNNNPTERFHFLYSLCQLCGNAKPSQVDKLMKIILPSPPTAQSMVLVSDLISFALCHSSVYTAMLDNMSSHIHDVDLVNIDIESWWQAESLANDSPSFCSALISRSDLAKLAIDKKLLAKWLQDLSRIDANFSYPSLNQLIRYSLFHNSVQNTPEEANHEHANSDLHFSILTLIQSKRCQTLTNQFLIDVVTTLSQQAPTKDSSVNILVDRYAQILSVGAANKVISITNALRNSLTKLESNQLIASVMRWQNK